MIDMKNKEKQIFSKRQAESILRSVKDIYGYDFETAVDDHDFLISSIMDGKLV